MQTRRLGSTLGPTGQRGWKWQPGGGSCGSGGSPTSTLRVLPAPLARAGGTVSSSVRVYGCCGSETTASVSDLDDATEVHDREHR